MGGHNPNKGIPNDSHPDILYSSNILKCYWRHKTGSINILHHSFAKTKKQTHAHVHATHTHRDRQTHTHTHTRKAVHSAAISPQ